MIFPNLIVKEYDNKQLKLINIYDGDEAVIDSSHIHLLNSIILKSSYDKCTQKENLLLKELEKNIGIIINEGVGKLLIRKGDLDSLDISLTNQCNLTCKHCYFFNDAHNGKNFIRFDVLKKVLIDTKNIGLYKVLLSGGEPFTYYRISGLLKLINDIGIHATIISNGLLINRFLKDISNSNLSFVVSIDGFKQSHEFLRGQYTYEKVIENIKKLIDIGCDVEINMLVYKSNINEIDEFASFVSNIGVSQLNLQVLRLVGRASQYLKDSVITDEHFLRKVHQNELKEQINKIENGVMFCKCFKYELEIDYKGDVFGCIFLNNHPIGNVYTKNITEIYEKGLTENPIAKINFHDTECSQCNLYGKFCAGGCRARSQKTTGSINNCDFWIPFLLNHSKFKKSKTKPHEFLFI